MNWELMTVKEQRMFSVLLLRSQNPYYLTIGGFMPLNWHTCVKVRK